MWWFGIGVTCGVVALANILGRTDLSRIQEQAILLTGVAFWLLGGLVCYAFNGIRFDAPSQEPKHDEPPQNPGTIRMACRVRLPAARKSQEPAAAEALIKLINRRPAPRPIPAHNQ